MSYTTVSTLRTPRRDAQPRTAIPTGCLRFWISPGAYAKRGGAFCAVPAMSARGRRQRRRTYVFDRRDLLRLFRLAPLDPRPLAVASVAAAGGRVGCRRDFLLLRDRRPRRGCRRTFHISYVNDARGEETTKKGNETLSSSRSRSRSTAAAHARSPLGRAASSAGTCSLCPDSAHSASRLRKVHVEQVTVTAFLRKTCRAYYSWDIHGRALLKTCFRFFLF
jgi:hypothetical protein